MECIIKNSAGNRKYHFPYVERTEIYIIEPTYTAHCCNCNYIDFASTSLIFQSLIRLSRFKERIQIIWAVLSSEATNTKPDLQMGEYGRYCF
jgi:hypothetical protein